MENVRGEEVEFKEAGELYRLSTRSPGKGGRSPVKDRKVLGDVGNTPGGREEQEGRRKRDRSAGRKAKEEQVKKDLNLSYIQSLPSNSLIILDNEGTWRKVFCGQLAAALSPHHVQLLERSRCLQLPTTCLQQLAVLSFPELWCGDLAQHGKSPPI